MTSERYLPPFKTLPRRHRLAANLTQESLAERAGLSFRTISDLERGLNLAPRAQTVQLLSQALALPPAEHVRFVEAAHRLNTLDSAPPDDLRPSSEPLQDVPAGPQPLNEASTVKSLPTGGYLGALPLHAMVARERELACIVEGLRAALAGSGGLILLAGEPGVGKTRLAQEAMLEALSLGFEPIAASCFEEQTTVLYAPMREALATAWSFASTTLRSLAAERFADLGHLLPEELPAPSFPPGEDPRFRIQRAVTGFLTALADERPLIVLLDDLHWADSVSLDLLTHVARALHGKRTLLLGTYRDTEVSRAHPLEATLASLARDRLATTVQVRRLPPEGTAKLVRDRLGQWDVPGDLCRAVHDRSDGNPFFADGLAATLAEQESLQPGSVCNADTVQSLDLPWSIRSVVGRRVSRLPSAGQDVLRLASVLGQEFDLPVLVAMADMDESVVLDQVEAALATRLLEERGGRQVERYAFVHALIAQALYEDMPRFRLRRLHGRAAEAIHRVHGQRPEVAAELARHLLAGGDDQRAAHFHELAGDHAATMFARVEAIGHFRAAVELLVSREENVAAATVQCKLGGWLGTLAQPDEAEAMLEAALATLETAGDAADQAVAHRVLAQIQHWCRHDWNGARAHVDAALRLWPAAGQDRELVSILLRAARGAGNDGDHETASSYIGRARDVAEQLGESAPRLWVLSETSAFCSLRKACRQA